MAKRKFLVDDKVIVYEKHFQNALKTVDLVVYAKDKHRSEKTKSSQQFHRNCAITEELNKMTDVNKENRSKNFRKGKYNKLAKANNKYQDMNDIMPTSKQVDNDMTWKDILDNYSSSSSNHESSLKDCKRAKDKCKESNALSKFTSGDTRPPEPEKVSRPSYQISKKNEFADVSIFDTENRSTKRGSNNIKGRPPFLSNVVSKVNKPVSMHLVQENNPTTTVKQRSIGTSMNNDDETHSPFGESALQLLMQLRTRLRSRGDSEESEMLSVIEKIIVSQGSAGNFAAFKKSQSETIPSPYPPVFFTPFQDNHQMEENYHEQHLKIGDQALKIREQELKIRSQEFKIKQVTEFGNKLLEYHQKAMEDSRSVSSTKEDSPEDKDGSEHFKRLSKDYENIKLELRNSTDIIFNMELKLAEANRRIEMLSRSASPSSGKNSVITDSSKKSLKEIDHDSAFDDKSASQSTSRSSTRINTSTKDKISHYKTSPVIENSLSSNDLTVECVSRDVTLCCQYPFQPDLSIKQGEGTSVLRQVEDTNVDFDVPGPHHFNAVVSQRGHEFPQKFLESTRLTKVSPGESYLPKSQMYIVDEITKASVQYLSSSDSIM